MNEPTRLPAPRPPHLPAARPTARPPGRATRASVPPLHHLTPEETARLHAAIDRLIADIRHTMEIIKEAVIHIGRAITAALQSLEDAGFILHDGRPIPPAARPAWASPYGPPPRRSHR